MFQKIAVQKIILLFCIPTFAQATTIEPHPDYAYQETCVLSDRSFCDDYFSALYAILAGLYPSTDQHFEIKAITNKKAESDIIQQAKPKEQLQKHNGLDLEYRFKNRYNSLFSNAQENSILYRKAPNQQQQGNSPLLGSETIADQIRLIARDLGIERIFEQKPPSTHEIVRVSSFLTPSGYYNESSAIYHNGSYDLKPTTNNVPTPSALLLLGCGYGLIVAISRINHTRWQHRQRLI